MALLPPAEIVTILRIVSDILRDAPVQAAELADAASDSNTAAAAGDAMQVDGRPASTPPLPVPVIVDAADPTQTRRYPASFRYDKYFKALQQAMARHSEKLAAVAERFAMRLPLS